MKTVLCVAALVETSPQAVPLGAACIVSALKSTSFFNDTLNFSLLDFSIEDFQKKGKTLSESARSVSEKIISENKDLFAVCFSIYVWNRTLLETVCALLKKNFPGLICIAGGPEVTANPASFTEFDYAVSGWGEKTVPLLLRSLYEKENILITDSLFTKIPGVYAPLKNDGNRNEDARLLGLNGHPATLLPLPRSAVLDLQEISSPWLDGTLNPQKYGGVLWELARGCPFKCSYCYESKGEQKIQYFPLERLEKELRLFSSYKVPQVFVLDPTYNASKKRALEMLSLIKTIAPDTFFYFEARAEFIDRELAAAFASVNCSLQFGLQSADASVLKNVNRSFDKKVFEKNIGFLNKSGAVFGFDLIYGLPGDTLQGFCASLDFALSLYPNNLELFCLSVLPGTDLYETAQSLGLTWMACPPYHVVESTSFSAKDLAAAKKLSEAADIFYNSGRAVPWFLSVLKPLRQKPSTFLREFAQYLETHSVQTCCPSQKARELQLCFVRNKYASRNLNRLVSVAEDLIVLNGALGEATATGTESVVQLHYHPDDLMSGYAADLDFFAKNAGKFANRTKVFVSKNGPDWKILGH
ncbi:radical SAM protein [uncultured Treponema sp.]|uniref:B12-binding domain-containing radical SAM protein n=1 Tax=uncultured Treponema sp. TaxID=162155 RepID=UPI00258966F6|nr:radical SAM protein [uncultured Treponema sp.]